MCRFCCFVSGMSLWVAFDAFLLVLVSVHLFMSLCLCSSFSSSLSLSLSLSLTLPLLGYFAVEVSSLRFWLWLLGCGCMRDLFLLLSLGEPFPMMSCVFFERFYFEKDSSFGILEVGCLAFCFRVFVVLSGVWCPADVLLLFYG